MDFIGGDLNLIPIPMAFVVMFLTYGISQLPQIKRDETGRLPGWFVCIPFLIGLLGGVPSYLVSNAEVMKTQPMWFTSLMAIQRGIMYGACAIGLWSFRAVFPQFSKFFPGGDK